MSVKNAQIIQLLYDEERVAEKIVQEGKEYKVRRLRDAKSEALKEIDELLVRKTEEYEKYEREVMGSMDKVFKEEDMKVEEEIARSKESFEAKKDEVINWLLKTVMDINPIPHKNSKY